MKERRISRRTRGSPDRVVLVREILPILAEGGGRVLWVGCRRYTDDYPALLERWGGECWTTDIDPAAAPFGHPLRHRTGDLTRIDEVFGDLRFDAVICNGVLGYGVDSLDAQRMALCAVAAILTPRGALLLGWNLDKIADPWDSGVLTEHFEPSVGARLPTRRTIPGTTHVYDYVVRKG